MRVAVVTTEPTASRVPQFDRLAKRPGLDLMVFYSAQTTQRRRWSLELDHPHEILPGFTIPLERVLWHDYPVTPAIWSRLERGRFDCVVIWGWSTFASELAVVWCRLRGRPYVLFAESQLGDRRPSWVRAVRRLVVPQFVRPAGANLVTGARARAHAIAYGADPQRIWTFANTVDTGAFAEKAAALRADRDAVRARLGVPADATVVLHVGRLLPQKGVDTLVAAVARCASQPTLLVVGEGPDRATYEEAAARLKVDALFAGELFGDELIAAYVAADVFALLSRKEPWGVVVNEAAACGLPLVLSERVGAAGDLLEDGENGFLVAVDDVPATANALETLCSDPALRARFGARSAELAAAWGYEPSEEGFDAAVHAAVEGRL